MNDYYDDNQNIGLSDQIRKEFNDAWEQQGKNYVEVIAEKKDLDEVGKLLLLYIAHENFKFTQLVRDSIVLINGVFEPNSELEGDEKLLWIMLFSIVDSHGDITTSRNHLQSITSMNKFKLKSAVSSLILKGLLSKNGDSYNLNIGAFVRRIAKQHNIKV